jgi:hypothetical protein
MTLSPVENATATATARALRRGRRGPSLFRGLMEVMLLGALLFLCSGYVRGHEPDAVVGSVIRSLQATAHDWLIQGWVHPGIADGVVVVLTHLGFFCLVLALAALIKRIPAFLPLLTCAEFQRRQGHRWSNFELLIGLSVPIAVAFALACHSIVSLFATVHVLLAYAYIRLSADHVRLGRVLDWWARVRTGLDMPVHDDHVAEPDGHAEEV